VKIKSLTVQGFRGFNEERIIDFHDRLTLIYAPNSYGKTSISEAFEWLLYGVTSKVEKADSKDEYKGSYRNRHLPQSLSPFVRVCFVEGDKEIVFTGELASDDTICKYVTDEGGVKVKVDNWSLHPDPYEAPRPFILQHALKYLLLVKPDERFQGFARLLGFEDLDEIHRNLISLCTAPERRIPLEVKELQRRVSLLETRLTGRPALSPVQKAFKKKEATPAEIYDVIIAECKKRVPSGTEEESLLPQLLRIREEAVGRVFKGHITLPDYSITEKKDNSEDEAFFVLGLTDAFVKEYTELIALANVEHILMQAHFFGVGLNLLSKAPGACPFCGQSLDDALVQHIQAKHTQLDIQTEYGKALEEQQTRVKETLQVLKKRLDDCHVRHASKAQSLLSLEPSMQQLRPILVPRHELHFRKVEAIIFDLLAERNKIDACYYAAVESLEKVIASVNSSTEDSSLIKTLGDGLVQYVAEIRRYTEMISSWASATSEADQILQHELDALAGTEDVSLLIDLTEHRSDIEKKFEVESILGSLKDLRKTVDQYVASRMLAAISSELSTEVLQWYGQIRTSGDPDVHFDGFDLERTQKGELKARRVQIKAKSYGQDLVSAVSSLSESKLNALGLCVSIATNLRGQSPFEFLIIDDPIQSLDVEHETQFIQVIRDLVDKCGKQVVLLSHNRHWLNQVCAGCRTLNGWFYEITGYTQAGPHISSVCWEKWGERLKVVDAILKDPESGSVRLQQAEEEIRIVVAELTSELYCRTKGLRKSPHNLNSTQVEKMLTECGVDAHLIDRVIQTFGTTDDSHHAPAGYSPDRERIRRYYAWAHDLAKLLN
jgi:DNA repair exonuclease SbcCD ATPase subunit